MGPLEDRPARQVRIILILGCLTGVATYLVTALERPDQFMLASDVYRHATASLLAGDGLYGVNPPGRSGYTFLYPPIAAALFIPHVFLGSDLAAFGLQTVLNLLAGLGTAVLIYRGLERRGLPVVRLDLVLLGAFMVLSVYSAIQFMNGQVNLWLAFALAVGFEAMDRDRQRVAGVAFAAVALVKVFPAILGIWLLRMRARTAVVAAIGTGVAGLAAGAIVFGPELTDTFVSEVLLGRFEGSTFDGQPRAGDSIDGVHRQLAALWPAGTRFHTPIGLVIVGVAVAAAMARVDTPVRRDAAALAAIVGVLLFLPVQPLYFPLLTFPLFMLLYSRLETASRGVLLAGTLLTFAHLDQRSVDLGIEVAPIPAPVASAISEFTAELFTIILPPTMGLWLLLFACILIQHPPEQSQPSRSVVAPADD